MQALVLIIDGDKARSQELRTLLEFMGGWHVAVIHPRDWQMGSAAGDVRAVFIDTVTAATRLNNGILTAAHSYLPPLVLLDDSSQPTPLPMVLKSSCCAQLKYPFQYDQLRHVLEVLDAQRSQTEQAAEQLPLALLYSKTNGQSETPILTLIQRVAPTDTPVLISGAPGSGKEIVARQIHNYSPRRQADFVSLNCSAITGDMLGAICNGLNNTAPAGYAEGFSNQREEDGNGTLFLDDIDTLAATLQVQLLQTLQTRIFAQTDSESSTKPRIVAATQRDLESLSRAGAFHEELFYALNVFPIKLPTLSECVSDLPMLVDTLLLGLEQQKRITLSFSDDAIHCLSRYTWPGNLQELVNLIERLSILYPNQEISACELPAHFHLDDTSSSSTVASFTVALRDEYALPDSGIDLKNYLSSIELRMIHAALHQADGVVARAAELLKIRRTTLVEKMRKYHITRGNGTVLS